MKAFTVLAVLAMTAAARFPIGTISCDMVRCVGGCTMVDGAPSCLPPPPATTTPPVRARQDAPTYASTTMSTSTIPPILTCATVKCIEGTECEMVNGRPSCIKYGSDQEQVVCGKNVCGDGQYCCNPSCGTCVAKGGFCTAQFCQ